MQPQYVQTFLALNRCLMYSVMLEKRRQSRIGRPDIRGDNKFFSSSAHATQCLTNLSVLPASHPQLFPIQNDNAISSFRHPAQSLPLQVFYNRHNHQPFRDRHKLQEMTGCVILNAHYMVAAAGINPVPQQQSDPSFESIRTFDASRLPVDESQPSPNFGSRNYL